MVFHGPELVVTEDLVLRVEIARFFERFTDALIQVLHLLVILDHNRAPIVALIQ